MFLYLPSLSDGQAIMSSKMVIGLVVSYFIKLKVSEESLYQ
jgi:hypothetical protein